MTKIIYMLKPAQANIYSMGINRHRLLSATIRCYCYFAAGAGAEGDGVACIFLFKLLIFSFFLLFFSDSFFAFNWCKKVINQRNEKQFHFWPHSNTRMTNEKRERNISCCCCCCLLHQFRSDKLKKCCRWPPKYIKNLFSFFHSLSFYSLFESARIYCSKCAVRKVQIQCYSRTSVMYFVYVCFHFENFRFD